MTENEPSKDGHCLEIFLCCLLSFMLDFEVPSETVRGRLLSREYQTALKYDRYTFYVLLRASQYRASGSVHPGRPPLLPGRGNEAHPHSTLGSHTYTVRVWMMFRNTVHYIMKTIRDWCVARYVKAIIIGSKNGHHTYWPMHLVTVK
jgi:hypothetical protein